MNSLRYVVEVLHRVIISRYLLFFFTFQQYPVTFDDLLKVFCFWNIPVVPGLRNDHCGPSRLIVISSSAKLVLADEFRLSSDDSSLVSEFEWISLTSIFFCITCIIPTFIFIEILKQSTCLVGIHCSWHSYNLMCALILASDD